MTTESAAEEFTRHLEAFPERWPLLARFWARREPCREPIVAWGDITNPTTNYCQIFRTHAWPDRHAALDEQLSMIESVLTRGRKLELRRRGVVTMRAMGGILEFPELEDGGAVRLLRGPDWVTVPTGPCGPYADELPPPYLVTELTLGPVNNSL